MLTFELYEQLIIYIDLYIRVLKNIQYLIRLLLYRLTHNILYLVRFYFENNICIIQVSKILYFNIYFTKYEYYNI